MNDTIGWHAATASVGISYMLGLDIAAALLGLALVSVIMLIMWVTVSSR